MVFKSIKVGRCNLHVIMQHVIAVHVMVLNAVMLTCRWMIVWGVENYDYYGVEQDGSGGVAAYDDNGYDDNGFNPWQENP